MWVMGRRFSISAVLAEGAHLALLAVAAVSVHWEIARGAAIPADPARPAGGVYAAAFISNAAATGESVLWNPADNLGFPFYADWRNRVYAPFNALLRLIQISWAIRLGLLAKVILAGWAAYYAARRIGFQPPFAILFAAAFQHSPPFMLWLDHPLTDAAPLLPLFFLLTERLAVGHTGIWPIGALLFGLAFLGGGLFVPLIIAAFFGVYLSARAFITRKQYPPLQAVGAFAASVFAGLAFSGIQLVPYLELLQFSQGHLDSNHGAVTLMHGAAAISPQLFAAAPEESQVGANLLDARALAALHFGIVPLLASILWLALRHCVTPPHRLRMDLLLALGAAAYLSGLVWQSLPGLPAPDGNALLAAAAMLGGFAFSIAGVAAAEAWLELNPDQCTSALKRLALIAPVAAAVVLASALVGIRLERPAAQPFYTALAFPLAGAAGFAAIVFITLLKPSPRIMGYGIAVLAAFELVATLHPLEGSAPASILAQATEAVQRASRPLERVGGRPADAGVPGAASASGRRELERSARFWAAANADPLLQVRAACNEYVLSKDDVRGPFGDVRAKLRLVEVYPRGMARFEHLDPHARARVIFDVREFEETANRALDSRLPPLLEGNWRGNGGEVDSNARATVTEESHTRVAIKTESVAAGLLVLADAYYPGWTALIDDTPVEVWPLDTAFRAVAVPAGSHQVVFTFAPASKRWGLAVTLAGAAIIALGLAALGRRTLQRFLAER